MAPALGQIFPPNPTFVEKDMPDLTGKVTIVSGATSGVGFNTASILYSKNATVYIAARSADKARTAINEIQTSAEGAHSRGRLSFLQLDLSNLASIKESANKFLELEDRLDILIHNAGVMTPPAGSKTITGHDLEMGTNCLGPFLFNKFLLPLIQRTAAAAPVGSVRVVWLSSMISSFTANGGIIFDEETGAPKVLSDPMQNYMESKVGNVFIAKEMANRYGGENILSLSVHPGLMKTELQRHSSAIQATVMGWIFKGPRYGAYSELFAALSPEVTQEKNGAYIIPWGRFGPIPCHLQKGLVSKRDGGAGTAERFWSWCEEETAPYL